MSKPMILRSSAISEVRTAPTTPPAGPERIASLPWKSVASVSPPELIMNISFPFSASAPSSSPTRSNAEATRSTYRRRIGLR